MEDFKCASSDLDLTNLSDEALVALVAEGLHPARVVLLLRYYDWSRHLLMRLARHRGLTPDDTDDALQDAVFAIVKAISEFRRENGCLFQTFLRRVLTNHFKDYAKHLWRMESHFGRPLPKNRELKETRERGRRGYSWCLEGRESDPADMAQRKELAARVRNALANLEGMDYRLVGGLLTGRRLRALASELGISYDAAKRRWRRLRIRLAWHLGELIN